MIRGHPHWASCPSCGHFKAEGIPCRNCGYTGSPIPARATLHFPISQSEIPTTLGGTLTFSASASMVMHGLSLVEERIMDSDFEPEERVEFRSYLGLAQELIFDQTKKRKDDYPEHLEQYRERISEYRQLIDDNKEEPDYQSFFEINPNFLVPNQTSTIPLPNYGGEFEPDFMIEASNGYHWIIEIEKPGKLLFTKKNTPRSLLTKAEQQIRDYMRWARDNIQFLKDRDWPLIRQDNMRGLLIYGKRLDLSPIQESILQAINYDRRASYQIKTFDDILTENETFLENLRNM